MKEFATKSECNNANCQPKGYWFEKNESGEKLYCHKVWSHGKKHIVKTPIRVIIKESEETFIS